MCARVELKKEEKRADEVDRPPHPAAATVISGSSSRETRSAGTICWPMLQLRTVTSPNGHHIPRLFLGELLFELFALLRREGGGAYRRSLDAWTLKGVLYMVELASSVYKVG